MRTVGRADLVNGSLVLVFAIQTAVALFCLAHRVLDIPLVDSRGPLGVQVPWLFVGFAVIVSVAIGFVARRIIVRSARKNAGVWLLATVVATLALLAFYLDTFTLVFRS